ncbi:MAG TPA: hypothetical protein VMZ53_29845 [Kofleriaceae bacterium]|nr:hypothetical protein [Kofleriaceae bacterium]
MKHLAFIVAVSALAVGCVAETETGDDDGTGDMMEGSGSGSGSDSQNVTCNASATVSPVVSASRIDAVGKATCSATPSSVTVETCIQWKSSSSTSFTDMGCASASKSGVATLEEPFTFGCGISTAGKLYRTHAKVKLNGTVVAEASSNEVTCY